MKITFRNVVVSLALAGGVFALAGWSARIGRKVWSPRVFAWRNPFKPQPIVEEQADCPVDLVRPRFYSFMSVGSSIGSVLNIDLKNISNKPIHSFMISYSSSEPLDRGASGYQLERLLKPEQFYTIGTSSRGTERVTFSIDFIQFADGDVWFANPPSDTVKPDGVQAGAQAAAQYLCEVLQRSGADAVMKVLPRINVKMGKWRFSEEGDFGNSGFNYGIKKVAVSVEHAFQKGGLSGVEKFLESQKF